MAVFKSTDISMKYVSFAFGYLRARLSTLCGARNKRINIFAKNKPVKFAYAGEDIRTVYPNWYKGKYNNCGIKITGYNSPSQACKAVWEWDAPDGGDTEPFRLGDFRGYNPDAIPFVQLNVPTKIEIDINRVTSQVFYATNPSVDKTTNLSWDDFTATTLPLKNCYLGCYVEKDGSENNSTFLTGTNPIYSSMNDVELNLRGNINGSKFSTGTYYIYFCLCSEVIAQDGETYGPTYWPLYHNPNMEYPIKMTIRESLLLPFSISVPQIAAANNLTTAQFVDINTVTSPNTGVLNIRSKDIYLKAILKNEQDTGAYTVNKESIVVHILDYDYGSDYEIRSEIVSSRPWLFLMNASGTIVNQIDIPAKSSVTAYVVIRDLMYGPEGNMHPSGEKYLMMMEFATEPNNTPGAYFVWQANNINLTV